MTISPLRAICNLPDADMDSSNVTNAGHDGEGTATQDGACAEKRTEEAVSSQKGTIADIDGAAGLANGRNVSSKSEHVDGQQTNKGSKL
jgi:hypothetical protein